MRSSGTRREAPERRASSAACPAESAIWAAAAVSLYFLWQHELALGLLIHFVPPPVASVAVMRFADLERSKDSRLGVYLLRYMTPTAQAARLLGDLVLVFDAWFRSPP